MSERPTPETDAASWIDTNQANALTLASFSRQLELQRDEARELARELRDVLDDWECLWRDRVREISGMTFAAGYPVARRSRELLAKAKEVLP